MAKKKQPPEERKPDLAIPDQDALEERVKEMLDIESSEKRIEVSEPEEKDDGLIGEKEVEEISSAPELPSESATEEAAKQEILEEEPEEKIINLDEAPTDEAITEEPELTDEPAEPNIDEPLLEDETTEDQDLESVTPKKTDIDTVIEDEKTGKAVDDIVAKEGDDLLEVEDEKSHEKSENLEKKGPLQKIKHFFKAWWDNPKARWTTIAILIVTLVIMLAVPTSRYYVLNTVGVRSSASITVLDESTGQPLKNVEVSIAGSSSTTDTNGFTTISKVKLGNNDLIIHKRAFAEAKQKVTIKMGTNKLADIRLVPTGEQYSFIITDYMTGKPIQKVEAVSGDASALSDDQGRIKLTVEGTQDIEKLEVVFKKDDYREEKTNVNPDDKSEMPIVMVPSRKHVFVSKRSGKYDVYSIYVDGKDEKLLLAGTGSEREDLALSIHPTSSVAALVSTRGSKTNSDGFRLSTLTIVDDQSDKTVEVTESERIQVIDWIGDNLIYVQAASGASANNPKRHRLVSYNYKINQANEIATSNYFNDVVIAGGKIYYAPSSALQPNDAKLFRVNADGSQKTTIANQEIWNIFRTDYDNLALSANQTWLNLRIGEDKTTSMSAQPTNPNSRTYLDSKDGKNSLWTDERDGKGTLLNYEISSKNEQVLKSENGLVAQAYWLNNRTVIYRISNQKETADYVISLDGGEARKVADVTNTNSINQWYYY